MTDSTMALPWSQEAEVAALSEMLQDPDAVTDVRGILTAGDFFRSGHRRIYGAIVALWDAGRATDIVSVVEALKDRGELEEAGGVDYVSSLLGSVPAGNAAHHSRIVRDKARLRRFIRACQESVKDAVEGGDPEFILRQAEARILAATELDGGRGGYRPVGDAVHDALCMIERAAEAKDGIVGIPTGFRELDQKLSGLEPGLLTVLAGRPSMGKSAMAWVMAEHAARVGHGVSVASYEMSGGQLARRGLAGSTGIDSYRLRRAHLDPEDHEALGHAASDLSGLPVWIDEHPGQTIEAVTADVRRLKARASVDFVVVDYLQQMRGRGQNRNNEVEHIARGLKRMARDLDVHVLVLAQLNRAVEHRTPPRPVLSDLRDSGAVEQDADTVLLLWRPERYFDENTSLDARAKWEGRAELIVAKQRDGETGTIHLAWNGKILRFTGIPA